MLFELKTKHDDLDDQGGVKTYVENYWIETETLSNAIERLMGKLDDADIYFVEAGKQVKIDAIFLKEDKDENFYKVTTNWTEELDSGKEKIIKDVHLVNANSLRKAEDIVSERVIDNAVMEIKIVKSELLNMENIYLLEESSEYPQEYDAQY